MSWTYIDDDTGATVDADWWPGDPIKGRKMANDDPNDPILIAPLRRAEDGKLGFIANPQEAFMASPPKQRTRLIGYREGKTDHGIHAIMAHMESELLNLPDYATARFKALLGELKAKL